MGHRRQFNAATAASRATYTYRYNPYSATDAIEYLVDAAPTAAPAFDCDVLHTALTRRVTFVPYPTHAIPCAETDIPKEHLKRIFVGQLPYAVTDMQLTWLCETLLGGGRNIYHVERIIKWNHHHQPKGCIHAYCVEDDADAIIECLNRRVLFDDVGVWFAATPTEQTALIDYCNEMKKDATLRFRDRPYQPVVVQVAHSTFVPNPRRATPPPQAHSGRASPPAYNEFVGSTQLDF